VQLSTLAFHLQYQTITVSDLCSHSINQNLRLRSYAVLFNRFSELPAKTVQNRQELKLRYLAPDERFFFTSGQQARFKVAA